MSGVVTMTKRYILDPADTCGKIPTRLVNTDPMCRRPHPSEEEEHGRPQDLMVDPSKRDQTVSSYVIPRIFR